MGTGSTTMARQIEGARRGDEQDIASLVARLRPAGLRLAEGLLGGDRALAEDAVQEALITTLGRLEELREPEALSAWFRQIVRTCCNRTLRRQRPERPWAPTDGLLGRPGASPDEPLERRQLRQALRQAVASLPEPGRTTATLFYLEQRPHAEISAALGVPSGTVKRRLHDARARMRAMLLGHLDEGGPR